MVVLASLHVGSGVRASGNLALADISTRSMPGPSFAGWTVVLTWDFVASQGCQIWVFVSFNRSEIAQASRPTYTHDLVALGTPQDCQGVPVCDDI